MAELKSWRATVTEDGTKLALTITGLANVGDATRIKRDVAHLLDTYRPKGQKALED